ncbi:hypothetical protein ACFLQ6_02435 [Thermoproteota archaeon]
MKSYDTIDVFRGIGAAIILLVIIGISIHYYYVEEDRLQQEELQAKEEPVKPGRLVIIMPNEVHVNQEVPINIVVVDLNGSTLVTREDLIEISLLTQGKCMVGIKRTNRVVWSRNVNLQLNNGISEFWFKATDIETITIIARQLSGDTSLEETRIMFIILRE